MSGLVVMAALLALAGVDLAVVGLRFRAAIRGFDARAIAGQAPPIPARSASPGRAARHVSPRP